MKSKYQILLHQDTEKRFQKQLLTQQHSAWRTGTLFHMFPANWTGQLREELNEGNKSKNSFQPRAYSGSEPSLGTPLGISLTKLYVTFEKSLKTHFNKLRCT